MKAYQAFLYDSTGLKFDANVVRLEIKEELRKTGEYHITLESESVDIVDDARLWKNATVQLKAGVAPVLTSRKLVVREREKDYSENGNLRLTIVCKCAGGRAQGTIQDRVWKSKTPLQILEAIASKYKLTVRYSGKSPGSVMEARHQRVDDWEYIRQLCERMECDWIVRDNDLLVVPRGESLTAQPVRKFVWKTHKFKFMIDEGTTPEFGKKAAAGRLVSHNPKTDKVTDSGAKTDDPSLAKYDCFTTADPDGLVEQLANPQSVPDPVFLKPSGNEDPGAPEPAVDWDGVYMKKKAKARRRELRDITNKATIRYDEWDERGVPVPGTIVEIQGLAKADSGNYFVLGYRIVGLPYRMTVELKLTRHATNVQVAKKTKQADYANLLAAMEIAGQVSNVVSGFSSWTKKLFDWGG